MFCPKCGAMLSQRVSSSGSTYLYCLPGDMALSWDLEARLEQRYGPDATDTPQANDVPYNRQLHGGIHWFCPGDGVRLNERLECPECGKNVRDLTYTLIELHPHRKIPMPDGDAYPYM